MFKTEISIPYIRFETRAVEDRNATIETGFYKTKDVDYVIIMPPGRMDSIEKVAVEWLNDITRKAQTRDGRRDAIDNAYPMEIVDRFKKMYQMYKEEKEIPEEGTAINLVGWLSPAEKQNIIAANIRTLEDLANATEEGLRNIGMGGRALRDKARNALATAEGGKAALQIEALERKIEQLQAQLEKQSKKTKKEAA